MCEDSSVEPLVCTLSRYEVQTRYVIKDKGA